METKKVKVGVRERDVGEYSDTKYWYWSSVKSAKASGRFDYLKDEVEDDEDTETAPTKWDTRVKYAQSVEQLIDQVGYPFSLVK